VIPDSLPTSNVGTRAGWAAALLLLVAAAAAVYGAGWPRDSRAEIWTRGLPGEEVHRRLVEDFGGDEFLLLRADLPASVDDPRWTFLDGLGRRLETLTAVARGIDPLHLPGAPLADQPLARLDAAARRPLAQALDLVATDGPRPRADFLAVIRADAGAAERDALVTAVDGLRGDAATAGVGLLCAGHPLVAARLDRQAARVDERYAPLLALVATVTIALLYRSLAMVAAAALPALAAAASVRALCRGLGWDSNLVLVAAAPVVLVVVLASSLHLVSAFRRRLAEGHDPACAARGAAREKRAAGALAAATTAAGFLVFCLSPLQPVRRLGIAVGVVIPPAVALLFLLGPAILSSCRLRARAMAAPRRWRAVGAFALRHGTAVRAGGLLVLLAGTAAFATLPRNGDALRYFPADTALRSDFAALNRDGTGLATVEVLATRRSGAEWEIGALRASELGARLHELPGQRGVFGPEDVLADIDLLAVPLLRGGAAPALRLGGRLDARGETARWTVRIADEGIERTAEVADAVLAAAKTWADAEGAVVTVTGTVPLLLAMQDQLVGTLFRSLGWTALVGLVFFLAAVSSVFELFAALAVNLAPVAFVGLTAKLLDFELDGATVMVGAVVLGLAVDNTFHLLRARRQAGGGREGLYAALDRVGEAAVVSVASLALGFLALTASGFVPTARFGLLCAVGAASSLAADLLLLPALVGRPASAHGESVPQRDAIPLS